MSENGLNRTRQEEQARKARKRAELSGAIVGRVIELPTEGGINAGILREVGANVHYRKAGHVALVHVQRDTMRANYQKTFFNQQQIERAIRQAPTSSQTVTIQRGALDIVETPYATSAVWTVNYWLVSQALGAQVRSGNQQPLDLHAEQRNISRELLNERNELTGQLPLWLGAIAAPNIDAAREALEPLEDVIETNLKAMPVRLLPRHA